MPLSGAIHIIVSSQSLLLDREVSGLTESLEEEPIRLDASEVSVGEVLTSAKTLPMFASMQVLWVSHMEQWPAKELSLLNEYLDEPNPATVLILTGNKADLRNAFYKKAKKSGVLTQLDAPKRIYDWLGDEVRHRGLTLDRRSQGRLIELVGKDVTLLSTALEQLELFCDSKRISSDAVDKLLSATREHVAFELTDEIAAGDKLGAYRTIANLIENRQSALGVLFLLARYVRQLIVCRVEKGSGLGKKLGVPPFVVKKLQQQSQSFKGAGLINLTQKIFTSELELKGGTPISRALGRQFAEQIVLERLVDAFFAEKR